MGILSVFIAGSAAAAENAKAKLPEIFGDALKHTRLTQPGGTPFHLKAQVRNQERRDDSSYQAVIEEYWVAPDHWRRTVKSGNFSETVVVNGASRIETFTGDYEPFWLRNITAALIDMVPEDFTPKDAPIDMGAIEQTKAAQARENVVVNGPMMQMFAGACSRTEDKAGPESRPNKVWTTVCFNEEKLFTAISYPYFNALYGDYRDFGAVTVPRLVKLNVEPGIVLEAKVTELSKLHNPDESLFAVGQTSGDADHFRSVRRREADARSMLLVPAEIPWTPIKDGKSSGVLTLAVYVDREGHVRETKALSSDNPLATEQVRKAVSQWKFKPQEWNGAPAQMETLLTFSFDIPDLHEYPILTNEAARKQASIKADPRFSGPKVPKGTEFTVRATVNEKGMVTDVENPNQVETGLFIGAEMALRMWMFKPYEPNGKPEPFKADIAFQVK